MLTLLIAVGALVGYLVAYHTYGRWLARRILRLDAAGHGTEPRTARRRRLCADQTWRRVWAPFHEHRRNGADRGPGACRHVGLAAGTRLGAAGVGLIGAVHDFGSLVVSLRNRGQTVGDIAARVLNRRVRFLFLFILFMALTIVLAIFGLVIAAVFRMYPASIVPCLVQIPIAMAIGVWLHRRGINLLVPSLVALALMYVTVNFGDWGLLHAINEALAAMPTIVWVAVLLVYSYIASVLPVWMLLQPRDYINSLAIVDRDRAGLDRLGGRRIRRRAPPRRRIAAAARNRGPGHPSRCPGAPPIWPFLFITVACGACSGFHCLVSSGTSSKQLRCEARCPTRWLRCDADRRVLGDARLSSRALPDWDWAFPK